LDRAKAKQKELKKDLGISDGEESAGPLDSAATTGSGGQEPGTSGIGTTSASGKTDTTADDDGLEGDLDRLSSAFIAGLLTDDDVN